MAVDLSVVMVLTRLPAGVDAYTEYCITVDVLDTLKTVRCAMDWSGSDRRMRFAKLRRNFF